MMDVVAELFGAFAVVFNFIGYRQNEVKRYLLISSAALLCLSIHFFMLDAMAAGIGCMLASIRNIVATRYRGQTVLIFFVAANFAFLIFEWFVLNNGWIILIAYSSSLIFTVGSIVLDETNKIRRWFVCAELLGLAYSLLVGSIFGSVFNVVNLISIASKLIQEAKTKKPAQ